MFERFTPGAREIVTLAQVEARGLGHDYLGTEHLLLGLLADRDGVAARVLARAGFTLERGRATVEEMLGRGDGVIDPDALASIGIDVDEVRRRVEASFGPGALAARRRCRRGRLVSAHMCFMPRAKQTLEEALHEARDRGDRYIAAEHVLVGLLREGEGVAAKILADAGIDIGWVRAAVDEETRLAG